jgi:hypothetical protein
VCGGEGVLSYSGQDGLPEDLDPVLPVLERFSGKRSAGGWDGTQCCIRSVSILAGGNRSSRKAYQSCISEPPEDGNQESHVYSIKEVVSLKNENKIPDAVPNTVQSMGGIGLLERHQEMASATWIPHARSRMSKTCISEERDCTLYTRYTSRSKGVKYKKKQLNKIYDPTLIFGGIFRHSVVSRFHKLLS